MKKFITFVVALVLGLTVANAQVAPAKFFDNTTVALEGGITLPLTDMENTSYSQWGVQLEKGITPWFSLAAEGEFYMGIKQYNTYTAFDRVNVNGLMKFNVVNLFGHYKGHRRVFEFVPFTGLGWGHLTACYGTDNHANWMLYKAGADFEFNLGKERAWALRFSPAVVWNNVGGMRLDKNNAELQLNVAVAYHFKNHDGNRYFTLVRPYDQAEIDGLNTDINALRDRVHILAMENESLRDQLSKLPKEIEVTKTITETIMMMPRTQFLVNSAEINSLNDANLIAMAEYMKANPNANFTIVGYASEEGAESYNLGLSERRAQAMYDALVNLGVNPDQMTVRGDGATEQFSVDTRALNRVVIVEQNK